MSTTALPLAESTLHPEQKWINDLAAKYDAPAASTPVSVPVPPATPEHPAPATPEHPAADAEDSDVDVEDSADTPDEADADDTDQDEDEDEESTTDPNSFAKELTRMGIDASTELAKITDPEARKISERIVKSKLADFQAGMTQLRQRDRASMEQLRTFEADVEFQQKHMPTIVAHRYQTDPAFADAVDAEVTRLRAHPDAHVYAKRDLDDARNAVNTTVQERARAEQSEAATLARIDVQVRQACEAVGLPQSADKPVSKAIRLLVADALDHSNGSLNRRQIERIITDYSREVRGVRRAEKRDASAQAVAAKVAAAKKAPILKPGTGTAPAPGHAAKPKNDDEFVATLAAKYTNS